MLPSAKKSFTWSTCSAFESQIAFDSKFPTVGNLFAKKVIRSQKRAVRIPRNTETLMNRLQTLNWLCCVAMFSLSLGCSSSSSMLTDAENTLRSAIDSQSKGQIKLVRFAKKDGPELTPSGYELLYDAEVEFASDGVWMTGTTLGTEIGFNFEARSGPEPKGLTAQFANQVLKDAGGGKD